MVGFRTCALLIVAALAVSAAGPAGAQQRQSRPPGAASATQGASSASPAPETPDSVTQHSLAIEGRSYEYTARAGTITLRNDQDAPTVRVFYTAYTSGEPATRPVTFIYNGGPGSSTMWLRMGSFGPRRVVAGDGRPTGPPPYRIADNPYSLLDKSDLVFIDMPTSGFGRLLPAGRPNDFYGVDQDVAAFSQFIRRYISTFGRWNSPKFLFGESYGTTRSAALSAQLARDGVGLNGVILLSSILNFGLDQGNGDPIGAGDYFYVFYLPTEAATAWYHNRVANKPAKLSDYLARVERFAMTDYFDALAAGARLAPGRRDDIARRVAGYIGVSEQFVKNNNLRVTYERYQAELLRSQGIAVGRLDSRYQSYQLDAVAERFPGDPTESAISAPYTAANNQHLRVELKYETPLEYRASVYNLIYAPQGPPGSGARRGWDMTHQRRSPVNVAPDLAQAMTGNPSLKIFSANGYYDFATPYYATEYTLKHLNLPPPLQRNITFGFYETGHMTYLSDSALAQFKNDLGAWYDAAQRGQ